ncbi:hypothetical protein [Candidatus Accumulibacter sp. ACC003]|uniref:hypothetical protein n=1 Tax=Candidatus Accumulibacter sp. ACC003 TaxID=2823334 RepID=UPI0025BF310B|nr:hypothetical protein [Candidatus Accumulibacter sp. ACC003]
MHDQTDYYHTIQLRPSWRMRALNALLRRMTAIAFTEHCWRRALIPAASCSPAIPPAAIWRW